MEETREEEGEIRRKTITSHSDISDGHAMPWFYLAWAGGRARRDGRADADSAERLVVEEDRPNRPIVYSVGWKRGSRSQPGGAKRYR